MESRNVTPPGSMKPCALFISSGYELSYHRELCSALYASGFRTIVAPWFSLEPSPSEVRTYRGVEIMGEVRREIDGWETIFPQFLSGSAALCGEALNIYKQCVEVNPGSFLGWHPEMLTSKSHDGMHLVLQSKSSSSFWIDVPRFDKHCSHLSPDTQILNDLDKKLVSLELFAIFDFANLRGSLLDGRLKCCLDTPASSESGDKDLSVATANVEDVPSWNAGNEARTYLLERIVSEVFMHTAGSQSLTTQNLSRLLLPVLIKIDLSIDGTVDRCRIEEIEIPFISETRLAATKRKARMQNARKYARELFLRCSRRPFLNIPSAEFIFDHEISNNPTTQNFYTAPGCLHGTTENLPRLMKLTESRDRLLSAITNEMSPDSSVCFSEHPKDSIQYIFSRDCNGASRMDLRLGPNSDLSQLRHPLSAIFPNVPGNEQLVETEPWSGAVFEDLHGGLYGPELVGMTREESLLLYLGRVALHTDLDQEAQRKPFGRIGSRFVEPGVGRACLVDFLGVDARPELHDFSVTGIGLTPYSKNGFMEMGSPLTGRAALTRAFHRKRCAQRLEEVGCRTAPVLAIIRLPELWVTMLDGSKSPAALIVRGFRTAIRIKHLDPIASFYHSRQHAAGLVSFLHDAGWRTNGISPHTTMNESIAAFLDASMLDVQGARFDELARVMKVQNGSQGPVATVHGERDKKARLRRLQVLRAYAPLPLKLSRVRLAHELGRNPEHELPSEFEYVCWFATSMGGQLAKMRESRFLHDYHHEGTSRYTPNWINTLVDNNVTLMAEFPDLDTGIFLDREDADTRDELQMSSKDFNILVDRYEIAHRNEYERARAIVDTLTSIVSNGDAGWAKTARILFSRAYENDSNRALLNPCDSLDVSSVNLNAIAGRS
jgi:hypothetical protein